MDAPPPKEDVNSFIRIAHCLLSMALSAPQILASDVESGFLLIEDLGDLTYTKVLSKGGDEEALYHLATETLIEIQKRFLNFSGIGYYDDKRLLDEVALLVDWYLPAVRGVETPDSLRKEYFALWRNALPLGRQVPATLVLRDYHVDNLMFLSDRKGVAGCGLLDFQDALIGPSTYDLVSLLEDARREVPHKIAKDCLALYLAALPSDEGNFLTSYKIFGAQRSAKIIGIFARLDRRDGKSVYLKHIARVFRWLSNNLEHPALHNLKVWFDREIPVSARYAPLRASK